MAASGFLLIAAILICVSTATSVTLPAPRLPTSDDACKLCAAFAYDSLSTLLEWIELHKVVATCGELCNALNSTVERTVCVSFCDVIGVGGFVIAVKEFAHNPIYFCQVLHICSDQDCSSPPCVAIQDLVISPQAGHSPKETRLVNATLTVTSPVGAGIILFNATNQATGTVVNQHQFVPAYSPGQSKISIVIEGGTFTPGNYSVTLSACEGECAGAPHAAVLASVDSWLDVSKK